MGKWKKIRLIAAIIIAITLTFDVGVVASTSLDTITNNSAHSDIYSSEHSYVQLDFLADTSNVTLLIEGSQYLNQNKVGIYSGSEPTVMLELFNGSDKAHDSVTVNFDTSSNQAWVDENIKVSIGPTFGFYIDSSRQPWGGFFYSDSSLNIGADYGQTHALLFDTSNTLGIEGNPSVVVGFENLRTVAHNYDGDFDDMVVGLTNVTIASGSCQVPEPSTIIFLGFGCVALFGYRYR